MRRKSLITLMVALILLPPAISASAAAPQGEIIPFDEEHWDFLRAQKTEFLGRECLIGFAMLKDLEFSDGILEMDMAVTGGRGYAGFVFRVQDMANYEHFYIRPHREGLYGDDLQYAPVTNGISSWQLYAGPGYSSSWDPPDNEWFHVKLEVKGTQARVFVAGHEQPDLVLDDLRHGAVSGRVGVQGQMNGTAYFSDFRFTPADDLEFEPPRKRDMEPGMVMDWEISKVYSLSEVEIEDTFDESDLGDMQWQKVVPDEKGLVDIARTHSRKGREPDLIFARTMIDAEEEGSREYKFGYSDYLAVYLNGRILFNAGSSYRQRDPSFLGIVGLFDGVYLPLEKGENELVLMVAEGMGGWGFMARDEKAEFTYKSEKGWEAKGFRIPESVVYDDRNDCLYVANFDQYNFNNPAVRQSLSKLTPGGDIVDMDWVAGLANPTGMAIRDGRLYVVERSGVAVIDIGSAEVTERKPVPAPGFLNDIALADNGDIYISDTRKNLVMRYDGEKWEEWLASPDVQEPNALMIDRGKLYIGNTGREHLAVVDLGSREYEVFAPLGDGNIDGIHREGKKSLLVSYWDGRLYRVEAGKEPVKLIDTRTVGHNIADFGYIPGKKTVVLPGFLAGKVTSFKLD